MTSTDFDFSDLEAALATPGGATGGVVSLDAFADLELEFDANEGKRAVRERVEKHRTRDTAFKPLEAEARALARRTARAEKKRQSQEEQLEQIAILDMESDPFDKIRRDKILPFAACLYSEAFQPVMIWEENFEAFISKLVEKIEALPGKFIIYAHNGGRFDFMFLISKLRGKVAFKGRGIMSAKLGNHELRDSYHLIPEKLASYKKDEFDYQLMRKDKRNDHRTMITDYLLNDCIYLYDIVKTFLTNYGIKISIGQAAMSLLKKEYPECQNITESEDRFYRDFFFGGRVECFAGCGEWEGDYKLHDVNSMYPFVMAHMTHPIGRNYSIRAKGKPTASTCFVDLNCYSKGAFPVKKEGEGTTFPHEFGRYKVSVHEYKAALELKLIRNVTINYVVDNDRMTTFANFILPIYKARLATKEKLARLIREGKEDTEEFLATKKDDIFLKLLMNNAYGKFAQNPRRFKEFYLTDWDDIPDAAEAGAGWGDFPETQCKDYAIWSRPQTKLRFNNVGTAASITGGARATLLRAIHNTEGLLYCDTDSIISRSIKNVSIHKSELGAWDLEANIEHIRIAGKKLYAYKVVGKPEHKIRSKGVNGITWENMKTLIDGGEMVMSAFAPTITRDGQQRYMDRRVRATTARIAV